MQIRRNRCSSGKITNIKLKLLKDNAYDKSEVTLLKVSPSIRLKVTAFGIIRFQDLSTVYVISNRSQ